MGFRFSVYGFWFRLYGLRGLRTKTKNVIGKKGSYRASFSAVGVWA